MSFFVSDTTPCSEPKTLELQRFSVDYKNGGVTGMMTGRESYSAVAMVTGAKSREGSRTRWFVKSIVRSTNRDFQNKI